MRLLCQEGIQARSAQYLADTPSDSVLGVSLIGEEADGEVSQKESLALLVFDNLLELQLEALNRDRGLHPALVVELELGGTELQSLYVSDLRREAFIQELFEVPADYGIQVVRLESRQSSLNAHSIHPAMIIHVA